MAYSRLAISYGRDDDIGFSGPVEREIRNRRRLNSIPDESIRKNKAILLECPYFSKLLLRLFFPVHEVLKIELKEIGKL